MRRAVLCVDVGVHALGSRPGSPAFQLLSPPLVSLSPMNVVVGSPFLICWNVLKGVPEHVCQVTSAGPTAIFSGTFCPTFWMKEEAVHPMSRLKSAVLTTVGPSSPEQGVPLPWTVPHFPP